MKLELISERIHILLILTHELGKKMIANQEPVDYNQFDDEPDIYFIQGIYVANELINDKTFYIMPIYIDSHSSKKNTTMKLYGINKVDILGFRFVNDELNK